MTHTGNTPSRQALWLLAALQLRGVGPVAVRRLAEYLRQNPTASSQSIAASARVPADRVEEELAWDKSRQIIERCDEIGIRIISVLDERYPPRLRGIKDAPPILYVRGSTDAMLMPGCAVVGTRKASPAGEKIAEKIAGVLSKRKILTVSGLALGIDTAAHRGSLLSGGQTVAVLAHGLDSVHPSSNRKLAEQLLEQNGALVSEHPPGVPPRPPEFVRRNRIQSGMSFCSFIVESGEVGGAIHQAKFTREQGRPIFAVLPELLDSRTTDFNAAGGEMLVRAGVAIPVRNIEEVETQISRLHTVSEPEREGTQYRLL